MKAVSVTAHRQWEPAATEADGMAIDVVDVEAGDAVPSPARRGYLLVVTGTVRTEGVDRGEGAAAWWEPAGAATTIATALTPARIALLAFPGR